MKGEKLLFPFDQNAYLDEFAVAIDADPVILGAVYFLARFINGNLLYIVC